MVAVVVFAILRFSPGDPAIIMAGDGVPRLNVSSRYADDGPDQPVIAFFIWGGKAAPSLMSGVPVTKLIARLEPSMSLAVLTLIFTLLVAIPLGILAAWRARRSCWTAP